MKRCRQCHRKARRDEAGLCRACAHAGDPVAHPITWRFPFSPIQSQLLEPSVWPLDIDEALDDLKLSRPLHLA